MTDDELDDVFGTKRIKIGNVTYDVRVMLTRSQAKAIRRIEHKSTTFIQQINEMKTSLPEPTGDDDERDVLTRVLDAMEPLEDEMIDEYITAISALVKSPPPQISLMGFHSVASLFAGLTAKQSELMSKYFAEDTEHPL